jgi:hypothetical protein
MGGQQQPGRARWHSPAKPAPRPSATVGDLRFRRLVGESGWAALPPAVRERFGHRLGGSRTIVYAGEIIECRMNPAGRLLACAARIIGAPLPLSRACGTAALVSVTEDPASGGQYWMRIYGRERGRPQVIASCKSFSGPTGLEEYVGGGFGIALDVSVEGGALHFLSNHLFWRGAGLRLRLPQWLSPGDLRVSHADRGDGSFAFVLRLEHPRLGELVSQTAIFRERRPS